MADEQTTEKRITDQAVKNGHPADARAVVSAAPLPPATNETAESRPTLALPAEGIPAERPKRRGRRRLLTALLGLVVASMICSLGAFLGYTQGPTVATLLSSGSTFAQIGTEFAPCFAAASNDQNVRSFFRLFFGNRNRPTATPGPSPTLDPAVARVVAGSLVELNTRAVRVQTVGSGEEQINLFPLMQIVSDRGHKITANGVLPGDAVKVLAVRLGNFGLGGAADGPTAAPTAYSAICMIVSVSPQ